MTDAEMIEAQGGVGLAHTSLLAALITVLREKGVLSRDELNTVFDSALVGAENATEITAETSRQARRILEDMAGQLAGPKPR
jgi:hypothetical protein